MLYLFLSEEWCCHLVLGSCKDMKSESDARQKSNLQN